MNDLKSRGASDEEKRKVLTDLIERRLKGMEEETKRHHQEHLSANRFSFRSLFS